MKFKFSLSMLLLVCGIMTAWAQVPQTLSYQGVLKNADGTSVTDGNYTLVFKLYDVAVGGTALWSETQTTFVSQGVFNVTLGDVTRINLPFDRQYWLGVTVGAGPELTPRTQIASSAYSLNARSISNGAVTNSKIADRAVTGSKIADQTIDITKLNFTPLTSESDPQVGNNTTNYVSKWNGTALVSGTIFDNGNVGIGKTNPTQKLDVAGGIAVNGSAVIDGSGRWVGPPVSPAKSVATCGTSSQPCGCYGGSRLVSCASINNTTGCSAVADNGPCSLPPGPGGACWVCAL